MRNLLLRLVRRAAREWAENPEVRAKANEVLEKDVKPRAKKVWKETQPKIKQAKSGLKRFADEVKEEYKKGRDG